MVSGVLQPLPKNSNRFTLTTSMRGIDRNQRVKADQCDQQNPNNPLRKVYVKLAFARVIICNVDHSQLMIH